MIAIPFIQCCKLLCLADRVVVDLADRVVVDHHLAFGLTHLAIQLVEPSDDFLMDYIQLGVGVMVEWVWHRLTKISHIVSNIDPAGPFPD